MSNGFAVDDIAPPSGDYWQPDEGDKIVGDITYLSEFERENKWEKVERNLRIDLLTDDGSAIIVTVTTNADVKGEGYAKRDAKAVAAAVRKAGANRLLVGGRLGIQRLTDVDTKMGKGRDFAAEYRPPVTDPAPDPAQGDGAITGLI